LADLECFADPEHDLDGDGFKVMDLNRVADLELREVLAIMLFTKH
jgi:hypothetical protein